MREGPKKGAGSHMFTGTYFKLGRRRMAGGLEVRLGWSAVPVPVSQLPPEFLNRCASLADEPG